MRPRLLYLEVAQSALSLIPENKKTRKVHFYKVYQNMTNRNPALFSRVTPNEVRDALRIVFPLHKNCRQKQKTMKIDVDTAYEQLNDLSLNLLPRKHIFRESS
ncbi:MAG: hypothetical protein HEEMFOPI_02019 [Holosporales bacterium]